MKDLYATLLIISTFSLISSVSCQPDASGLKPGDVKPGQTWEKLVEKQLKRLPDIQAKWDKAKKDGYINVVSRNEVPKLTVKFSDTWDKPLKRVFEMLQGFEHIDDLNGMGGKHVLFEVNIGGEMKGFRVQNNKIRNSLVILNEDGGKPKPYNTIFNEFKNLEKDEGQQAAKLMLEMYDTPLNEQHTLNNRFEKLPEKLANEMTELMILVSVSIDCFFTRVCSPNTGLMLP